MKHKRFLAAILALLMMLSLTACSKSTEISNSEDNIESTTPIVSNDTVAPAGIPEGNRNGPSDEQIIADLLAAYKESREAADYVITSIAVEDIQPLSSGEYALTVAVTGHDKAEGREPICEFVVEEPLRYERNGDSWQICNFSGGFKEYYLSPQFAERLAGTYDVANRKNYIQVNEKPESVDTSGQFVIERVEGGRLFSSFDFNIDDKSYHVPMLELMLTSASVAEYLDGDDVRAPHFMARFVVNDNTEWLAQEVVDATDGVYQNYQIDLFCNLDTGAVWIKAYLYSPLGGTYCGELDARI